MCVIITIPYNANSTFYSIITNKIYFSDVQLVYLNSEVTFLSLHPDAINVLLPYLIKIREINGISLVSELALLLQVQ